MRLMRYPEILEGVCSLAQLGFKYLYCGGGAAINRQRSGSLSGHRLALPCSPHPISRVTIGSAACGEPAADPHGRQPITGTA